MQVQGLGSSVIKWRRYSIYHPGSLTASPLQNWCLFLHVTLHLTHKAITFISHRCHTHSHTFKYRSSHHVIREENTSSSTPQTNSYQTTLWTALFMHYIHRPHAFHLLSSYECTMQVLISEVLIHVSKKKKENSDNRNASIKNNNDNGKVNKFCR